MIANSKNPFLRKGWGLLRSLVKHVSRHDADVVDGLPPIIVNSLPKSGTHLLLQIAQALPGYTSYGAFLATTPSLTMHRKSDVLLAKKIAALAPGEVCPAHLHFSKTISEALQQRNAISLFIYRDPRAVFWSEMQYLLHMNRWHRSSRVARKLPSSDDQFRFFLYGNDLDHRYPFEWPRFSDRVKPFTGWLTDSQTFSCRFEELTDAGDSLELFQALASHCRMRSTVLQKYSVNELALLLQEAKNPTKSHTFRSGLSNEWCTALSDAQKSELHSETLPLQELFWNI